ncbi:hypothetical protein [Spirosoma sp. KNUC1025]|uniref:hypothetical protein n=1 Tax=Spirosoma sp. KNUC1025 TaxID=2894082 RepID=UPI00386A3B38|nr:hypothetical protein LN737_29060 [Spirosoma sp. KNUC1025]
MENESIKTKILADYKILLGLKFDSPQVVYDKLKLIGEHIKQLTGLDGSEDYSQAATLIHAAMTNEYIAFAEAATNDNKEQTLAQLKHKVAEACQLLHIHT